ncbi:MAG: BatD family protein [Myxococcota bacterium]|jgi:hypothetical protein|nr:BatD family protein [Myxococcota bacterium]
MIGKLPRMGSIALLLSLSLLASAAQAQDWSAEATIVPSLGTLGDVYTYRITVSGPGRGQVELERAPNFEHFVELGRSSATRMVDRNGQMSTLREFNFRLMPNVAGTLELAGAEIDVDGEILRVAPLSLEVDSGPGSTAPQSTPAARTTLPVPTEGDDYFIEVNASKAEVYLGEVFVVDYVLYRPSSFMPDLYDVQEPDFHDFFSQDRGDGLPQLKNVNRARRSYAREYIRSYWLAPLSTGTLNIEPIAASVPSELGLFGGGARWISSPSLRVEVLPLPRPMPKGFDVSNVGRGFQLDASASTTAAALDQLKLGDSVSITVTLKGRGLVNYARLNPIERADGFMLYGPTLEAESLELDEDELSGSRRFSYSFVPTREGELQIPPILLVYFELDSKRYVTLQQGPWPIRVSGMAENADIVLAQQAAAAQARADDELAAFTLRQARQDSTRPSPLYRSTPFLLTLLAMPLLYLGMLVGLAVLARRQRSAPSRKAEQAYKNARARLLKAKKATENQHAAAELRAALLDYLSDAWELRARSSTRAALEAQLKRQKAPQTEALSALLDWAERERYAPSSQETPSGASEAAQQIKRALRCLDELEKARRHPRK